VEVEEPPDSAFEPGRRGLLDQLSAGNVGRSVDVKPSFSLEADPTPIVGLDGDDETARAVTVTMSVPLFPASGVAGGGGHIVQGVVKWGIGGVQTEARFDVINGTTFSVLATWLRVLAVNFASPVLGRTIKVGAFVGYFPKPYSPGPQLTLLTSTALADGASEIFQIPAYAFDLSIITSPQGAYTIEYLLADGVTVIGTLLIAAQGFRLPIPGNAQFVRITNTSGGVMAFRQLIFRLAL
jgi:hypothetical protein